MEIKEFWDVYPNYNMGFLATNPETATEKLFGLSMHLLWMSHNSKTYQEFNIGKYYDNIEKACADGKPHVFTMHINGNSFDVALKIKEDICYGLCIDTKERIAFSRGIKVVIK